MTAPLTTEVTHHAQCDGSNHAKHCADVPSLVRRTSDLLHSRVPLTLLLDLGEPYGPDSVERFTAEGGDTDWIHAG